jgi:glycosyltransferase involved in cell wall biosynthesis
MKILIVSPVGEDVHIRRIPAALAHHNGCEVTVAAPERVATETAYAASGWLTLDGEEKNNGIRLVPVALRDPHNGPGGFKESGLLNLMKETQPDVIQIWGGAPASSTSQVVWNKLRACPKAKVVFFGFDQLPYRFSRTTQLKWKFLWSQMAGGVEANSEGVEAVRQAGFPRPLVRIFWGISTEEFRAFSAGQRSDTRKRLGFGNEKLIGYAGRFVPEKGLRELLAALRALPRAVQGVLIGAGPMQEELEREAATPELAGRLRVLSTMGAEKLAEYLNCFDALALPSLTTPHWKEQYGRVIGEAMACGVVVVGSDSGAIPEVIGEAGLVVREGDAQALERALRSAVFDEDVRARVIPAGIERAQQELSIEAMSRKLLAFYERI